MKIIKYKFIQVAYMYMLFLDKINPQHVVMLRYIRTVETTIIEYEPCYEKTCLLDF